MTLRLHPDARAALDRADGLTKADALPILEILSEGFDITWFKERDRRLWLAAAKPLPGIRDHFGLTLECFVIGNGYPKDFQQRTFLQDPPADLADRIDPTLRFIASNAPLAEASCAAWASTKKIGMVLIKTGRRSEDDSTAHLYRLLSTSLWRRDLFAQSEPVRLPSEFFGREVVVNEVLAKVIAGAPVAVFGLRKIGKSSLLGRVEDLLEGDENCVCATALLLGNSSRLKSGRWWHAALDIVGEWQRKLQGLASRASSKVHAKAEALHELVSKNTTDTARLAAAFEKDLMKLLRCAQQLATEMSRGSVRLVAFIDECDHLYPHLPNAGHWQSDFFILWNTLQTIKRRLADRTQLVYVLGGVNPSGVEEGTLVGEPNPLFGMQRVYLAPMGKDDAGSLLKGLGGRMGLAFTDDAVTLAYDLVGGHPLLLRRLGSAIHGSDAQRSASKTVTSEVVSRSFARSKRDFYSEVNWILEHLRAVAPDEERLLRHLALGGSQAYLDVWGDNEYRETFAHHLERYGLVLFEEDVPTVALPLIKDALKKPIATEFDEQKRQLKDLIDVIEQAVRARLASDLERDRTRSEAVETVVKAVPSDTKNRPLDRQQLKAIGEAAGLAAVLESLNWGDYETLLNKFHDEIRWIGDDIEKSARLQSIKKGFTDAHLVRHNNNRELKELIAREGFNILYARFCRLRDMLSS
jgi:hypothetical protein